MADKTFHSLTLPGTDPARVPDVAAEFNTGTSYAVRDYCTYQGILYRCTTAHTGAWNTSHFQATNLDNEFDDKLKIPPFQASAPANPRVGDLWIDNDEDSPILSIDPAPIAGSTNAVQSGGVKTLIDAVDVQKASRYLLTGDYSTSATYEKGQLVFWYPETFSSGHSYVVGESCVHNGVVYKCTTAHIGAWNVAHFEAQHNASTDTLYRCIIDIKVPESWTAAHWQATNINTEINRLRESEADTDMIAENYGDSSSYAVGDYVAHNSDLFKCISEVSDTGSWDPDDWSQVKIADEVSDIKSATKNLFGSTELIDINALKGTFDNFHRSSDITEGYTSIGNTGRASIVNGVAVTTGSGIYQILTTSVSNNQVLCVSGGNICIAFNIKDSKNFYFLKSYISGLQLYKRVNNISIWVRNIQLMYTRGFISLRFVGSKVYIFNDYVFDSSIDTDEKFDGTAGMVFGINNESYYTFGTANYVGLEKFKGIVSPHRSINNGSVDSISIDNGVIKLLVDRAQGYSDHNYYRSMLGFKRIPYDNCYSKFSCDFKLDESLDGADDFILVQWHDNDLVGIGLNPFIGVAVQKDQDTVYGHYDSGIYLLSFYSAEKPENNDPASYILNPQFKIGELDYTSYHHLDIECRIGYDVSTLPYIECKYDGELIFSGILPLGYKGQNGYNITFGIYGAHQWKTGEDWQSPASDKPFVTFKNVDYIG